MQSSHRQCATIGVFDLALANQAQGLMIFKDMGEYESRRNRLIVRNCPRKETARTFPWSLDIRAAFSRIDGIGTDCTCRHVITGGEQTKWYGSDSLI